LDPRYADIGRFLRERGHTTLWGYYGVAETAAADTLEQAIDDRHQWAQTQGENPKTRAEARWLIENHARLKRTLLKESAAYDHCIREDAARRHEEHLRGFIRGAIHDGTLARAAERDVRKLAHRLKVPASFLEGLIVELIEETGATRASTAVDPQTTQLMQRVQEVLANGLLESSSLDQLLEKANRRHLEPKVILRKIDDAVREQQTRQAAQTAKRFRRGDRRRRTISNLVEAVRGLYMAGAFSPTAARSIEREALGQGLDLQTAERLTAEALSLYTRAEQGNLDPWHVLGMGRMVDSNQLRVAYTELRRMAQAKDDPTRAAAATMRLDLAWARVRPQRSSKGTS